MLCKAENTTALWRDHTTLWKIVTDAVIFLPLLEKSSLRALRVLRTHAPQALFQPAVVFNGSGLRA
jgi:hypothetical protein